VPISEESELSNKIGQANAQPQASTGAIRQKFGMPSVQVPNAGGVPLDDLSRHLVVLAQEAAREVLTGYTTDERRETVQRVMDAGTAVEYLVKAVLAGLNPSLLADRTDPRSILTFAGVAVTPVPAASELKTITFRDSLRLIVNADPRSKSIEQDANAIMGARNAAAHMGLVDASVRSTFAHELVRIASTLLPILGMDKEIFWSNQLMPVVEALMRINDDSSIARTASKIAKARKVFDELIWGMSLESTESTLRALESRESFPLSYDNDKQRFSCPACSRSGWVLYMRKVHWESATFEYDDYLGVPSDCLVPIDLEPIDFSCPVCGLFLAGSEGEIDNVEGIATIQHHVWESVSFNDHRLLPPD
jgi:hypothetical protein